MMMMMINYYYYYLICNFLLSNYGFMVLQVTHGLREPGL